MGAVTARTYSFQGLEKIIRRSGSTFSRYFFAQAGQGITREPQEGQTWTVSGSMPV